MFNPRDRGAWWTAIYGVAQSQTRLKRLRKKKKVGYTVAVMRCDFSQGGAGLTEILLTISPSVQFSSVRSHSRVSDSLRPHELQHARPSCPSPTPRVHSDSRPSSQWCHPAISSSVIPFSSYPQSLPASGSFQRVNSFHEVATALEFQLQHHSFQRTPKVDLL